MSLKDRLRGKASGFVRDSVFEKDCLLVADLEELYESDVLSDWEIDFFESIRDQTYKYKRTLTDPQRSKIEDILEEKG